MGVNTTRVQAQDVNPDHFRVNKETHEDGWAMSTDERQLVCLVRIYDLLVVQQRILQEMSSSMARLNRQFDGRNRRSFKQQLTTLVDTAAPMHDTLVEIRNLIKDEVGAS